MKKILAMTMALAMSLSLVACGGNGTTSSAGSASSQGAASSEAGSASTGSASSSAASGYGDFASSLVEDGKLIMSTNAQFPPYEMVADGEGFEGTGFEGIDVEIAYAIAQRSEKSNMFWVLVITMPTWINMMVRTYAWVGILQDGGLINSLLGLFGIGPFKMMYTTFAVVLGMVYNFIPFMILQIHTSLTKMDKSYLEAAADLGANKVQSFLRVTLPLSLPGVLSGITLVFLPAVSSFFIPKLLGGGQYVLIGNVIETQFLTRGDWNFGSAISLIMAVIIMISMYITRKVDTDPAARGKED